MNKQAQGLTIETGRAILTAHQFREAGLANVMSMFSATGMSESERLESAYMLQRTIIEGYLNGVNIPGIMRHKEAQQGKLNLGFNDSHIPTGNAIQFDRAAWRSQSLPQRMGEFVQRLGARLSSRSTHTTIPRTSNAPRHFHEMSRSGGMKAPRQIMVAHKLAQAVKDAVWARSSGNVFQGLKGVQRAAGIPAPQVQADTSYPRVGNPQTSVALQDEQIDAGYQTRQEMVQRGMPAMQAMSMPARSGQASARTGTMGQMAAQMPASGRPNRVLLFTGSGWTGEINDAAANLDALGIGYDKISSLNGVDYSKYGAIFFAGGNAQPEWNAIAGNANELRAAITGGLNYIGNCAGAFLAGQWGSQGLGLTKTQIDYPHSNPNAGSPLITMWDGTTRHLDFEGGPGFDDVLKNTQGTRELASFQNGEAGIVSFNYGQGHVVLSAFHVGMSGSGYSDSDGSDDAYWQKLLAGVVAGSDPDGVTTPPTGNGGPNGGPNNNTTNNFSLPAAPTLGMSPIAPAGGGGGGSSRVAPSRKTPVAGVLPQGIVNNSFAAGISSIINRHTPMLNQISGNFVGGKGAG